MIQRLDEDTLQQVMSHVGGRHLSCASMACRLMGKVAAHSSLWWARLTPEAMGRLNTTPLWTATLRRFHLKWGEKACAHHPRHIFAHAYLCCKLASRLLRSEYVASFTLLDDSFRAADALLQSAGHRDIYMQMWRRLQRVVLEYPIGSIFDAAAHCRDMLPHMAHLVHGLSLVQNAPVAIIEVLMKNARRLPRKRDTPDVIWGLRRLGRRFAYLRSLMAFSGSVQ